MKNKGDFLMNNFLSFFIAVVCVVLFAFFIGNAIYQARASDELTNAKKTIELIEAKTNALDEGQKSELTIQGFAGAERWYIVGWNKNDPNRPEKCFFDSCICICNGVSNEICQKKGICIKVDQSEVLVHTLPFDYNYQVPVTAPGIHLPDDKNAHFACIPLMSQLIKFNVLKEEDRLDFAKESPGILSKLEEVKSYFSCKRI